MHAAMMIDMVDSRGMDRANRVLIQHYVKDCLEALNHIFRPALDFEVLFSAGDEVQGLFHCPQAAYMYFRLMQMIVSPLQLRCGIGAGEWEVRIPSGTSTEQDGAAYHMAREAIQLAHRPNSCNAVFLSDNDSDLEINTLLQAAWLLGCAQSRHQQRMQLTVERMAPLFDKEIMDIAEMRRIDTLLTDQQGIRYFSQTSLRSARIMTQRTAAPLTAEESVQTTISVPKASEAIEPFESFTPVLINPTSSLHCAIPESTLPKGISSRIARQTSTTRQNIENILRKGNIHGIRSIDLITLRLLSRIGGSTGKEETSR